jgi:hypothetical protein
MIASLIIDVATLALRLAVGYVVIAGVCAVVLCVLCVIAPEDEQL